jgi:O-antigen/teichoic acid export membrane protein
VINKLKSLKNHQGFMKYLKNTSWLLGGNILRMIVGLFIGVWVARYLGPDRFGLLSYSSAFVGLFSAFATLGLDSIVIRALVVDESKRDVLLGTAFWLKVVGSLIVVLLLYIAVHFTNNSSFENMLIFIIAGGTVLQSFNVIDFYFQSKVLSKYVVYANTISLFISSALKIFLILTKAPLIDFVWLILLDIFISTIGFIFFYYNQGLSLINWKFQKKVAMQLLKDSWPLILSGLVISIYMRIDQVMIKEMIGSDAVGQYSAAIRISEVWYFIPMTIVSSLFPAIINAKKQSEVLYYERMQKLYDLMAWMAIAIALPMTFLSDWIIHLLYGDAYTEAGKILMTHIWAGVFVFLGVASSKWFVAENMQIYSFYRTLAGAIINIVLNYVLIPIYGIYGAALATLISQAIASYIFNATNKKLKYTFLLQTNAILLPFRKLGVKFG